MWTGSFLRSFGITSKQPPSFHESRLKGWFLDIIQSTTFFQSKSLNHIGPPPKKWPNIFLEGGFWMTTCFEEPICPLHKGYSNPFARPSYLQPKLPPAGQTQGKLCRFRGVSVNFVGFEERMEYPLGNDHISPPSKGTFLESMMFRISV